MTLILWRGIMRRVHDNGSYAFPQTHGILDESCRFAIWKVNVRCRDVPMEDSALFVLEGLGPVLDVRVFPHRSERIGVVLSIDRQVGTD